MTKRINRGRTRKYDEKRDGEKNIKKKKKKKTVMIPERATEKRESNER